MKTLDEIRNILAQHKEELRLKYRVKDIGIFGSYVRGTPKRGSDLDILVEFEDSITLLQFVNLENYLSQILGVKTDLVMKDSLKPRIGRRILSEVVTI